MNNQQQVEMFGQEWAPDQLPQFQVPIATIVIQGYPDTTYSCVTCSTFISVNNAVHHFVCPRCKTIQQTGFGQHVPAPVQMQPGFPQAPPSYDAVAPGQPQINININMNQSSQPQNPHVTGQSNDTQNLISEDIHPYVAGRNAYKQTRILDHPENTQFIDLEDRLESHLYELEYPEGRFGLWVRGWWIAQVPLLNLLYTLYILHRYTRSSERYPYDVWWYDTRHGKQGLTVGWIMFVIWFPVFLGSYFGFNIELMVVSGLAVFFGTCCCMTVCWDVDICLRSQTSRYDSSPGPFDCWWYYGGTSGGGGGGGGGGDECRCCSECSCSCNDCGDCGILCESFFDGIAHAFIGCFELIGDTCQGSCSFDCVSCDNLGDLCDPCAGLCDGACDGVCHNCECDCGSCDCGNCDCGNCDCGNCDCGGCDC